VHCIMGYSPSDRRSGSALLDGRQRDRQKTILSGYSSADSNSHGRLTTLSLVTGETVKSCIFIVASLLILLASTRTSRAKPDIPAIPSAKAEMMGRVEDFFLHNFRDITWRKSIDWSEVQTDTDGARSITYKYEAKIWDKETMTMSQIFTFAADGKFLRYKDQPGFPQKTEAEEQDVT